MNEILILKELIASQERRILELEKGIYNFSDRQEWTKNLKVPILLGYGNGVKIGAAITEKIAFLGSTPVSQQAAITTPTTPSAGYVQSEAASAKTAIDAIRTTLQTYGFIA